MEACYLFWNHAGEEGGAVYCYGSFSAVHIMLLLILPVALVIPAYLGHTRVQHNFPRLLCPSGVWDYSFQPHQCGVTGIVTQQI